MTNYDFLKKYQKLQIGIMSDQVINLKFGLLTYCKNDKSSFWNNVLVNGVLTTKQLKILENKLVELERKPAVYLENREDLLPLNQLLEKNGYNKTNEDSWMFYEQKNIDEKNFNAVKIVASENDLGIFLKVFDQCYQKDDPQNVYGELGEYLTVAKNSWLKFKDTNRLEYFLIFKNDEPVAVSTLTNFESIGYISNAGSLKKVRGEGYGKIATLFAVKKSMKHANIEHCLATEEGTYPNEFYKRIGFKTRFTAPLFTKK